jgi:hypothetical protein
MEQCGSRQGIYLSLCRVLNAGSVQRVRDHGFCVLADVLDAATVEQARIASAMAAETAAAAGYPTVMEALDPGGRNIRIPDLIPYDPIFAELALHSGVLPYVEALLTDDWLL